MARRYTPADRHHKSVFHASTSPRIDYGPSRRTIAIDAQRSRSATRPSVTQSCTHLTHVGGVSAENFLKTFDRVLKRSGKVIAVAPELPDNDPSPPAETKLSVPAQIKHDRTAEAYHLAALRMLHGEIDQLEAAGVPRDRIIIVGFSQGALVANSYILSLARNRSAPQPAFAAIFSFSGDAFKRIPAPNEWSEKVVKRTSATKVADLVFLSGGRNDNVLDQQRIKDTKMSIKNAFLGGARNCVRIELIRGQGHCISHPQISRIMAVVRGIKDRDQKRRQKAQETERKQQRQEYLARLRESRRESDKQSHDLEQSKRTTSSPAALSTSPSTRSGPSSWSW